MTTDKNTSAKKSSDRIRARDHKKRRKQQRRDQRRMLIIVSAIVVAVAVAATVIMVNRPADAPIPDGTFERYGTFEIQKSLPQSVTDEGFPVLGNPNAPVRVEAFSSFTCTFCAQFHDESMDALIELAEAGVISYRYVPVSIGGTNPVGAARAALCAGEQGLFFEFHDALFFWQQEYGTKAFSQNRLASADEELPGLDQGEYDDCVGSSYANDVIEAAQDEYMERELTQVPVIFINGNPIDSGFSTEDLVATINEVWAETGLDAVPPIGDQPETTPEVEMTPDVEATPDVVDMATPEATEPPVEDTVPEATEEAAEND